MLVGISGYAGSGKDTAGKILVEKHGFTRLAFADKVRDLAYELNPDIGYPSLSLTEVVDNLGWDEAKQISEVREYLQTLGTKCREVQGESVWIDALVEGHRDLIDSAVSDTQNVVITDVRFWNEASWIEAINGEVWRINRPGVGPANGHASETALDDWEFDTVIQNNGTLEDLEARVNELIGE